jgi:hypothetical protein
MQSKLSSPNPQSALLFDWATPDIATPPFTPLYDTVEKARARRPGRGHRLTMGLG